MTRQHQKGDNSLGQWVREARTRAGLTQTELTKMAGFNGQSTLSKVEHGTRPMFAAEMLRIAAATGHPLPVVEPIDWCPTCKGSPPSGFTCNQCGAS